MVTFQKVKIKDVCKKISSGGTPSRKRSDYFDSNEGHLWVKSKELLEKGITNTEEKISELGLQNSSAKYYPANTVLIAMYGVNAGQLAWLKKPATVNQAICALVVDDKKASWKYMYYSLLESRQELISQARGAAQPNLNKDMVENFQTIMCNDLETQISIASILSAYDDLIENNEKRIKVLEEMAQLLYTEWFVKFKFSGHEKAKMVDSDTEYGMIPEEWEVKKISDLYVTSSGGTPSRRNEIEFYKNGSIPWVKTKELNDNYILDTEEKITELAVKKSSAKIFPKNTVLIAMYGATIGKLGILSCEAATNQACCAFLLKDKVHSGFYIFQFLSNNIKKITGLAFGAAQPNISQNTVRGIDILSPEASILEEYNKRVEPIFNGILIYQKQIENLAQVRDLLIPELVTGKRIVK